VVNRSLPPIFGLAWEKPGISPVRKPPKGALSPYNQLIRGCK
jgi:hypothetical protein